MNRHPATRITFFKMEQLHRLGQKQAASGDLHTLQSTRQCYL